MNKAVLLLSRRIALLPIFLMTIVGWAQNTALFYMTDEPESVRSYYAHERKIGILVPAWYKADADGLLIGEPNLAVLEDASQHQLPVMPIIALFDKKAFHALASKEDAQRTLFARMVQEARLHQYSGFQLDFENINWTDRDMLSHIVAEAAKVMHAANLKLSIATVPNAPGYPGGSSLDQFMWRYYRGAYDLQAIGKSADQVCLMTYDQHSRWTPPGPVAGWEWTRSNLEYALQAVPKEKLLLGIPLYGYHWYSGDPFAGTSANEFTGVGEQASPRANIVADYISGSDAIALKDRFHASLEWDKEGRSARFSFYRDQMLEWVYFTDRQTFLERLQLANRQQIGGFCSWVLGQEDPAVWEVLPDRANAQ